MNKKIIGSILIPLIIGGVLLNCSKGNDKENAAASALPTDEAAIAVALTAVKTGDISLPVVSSGLVSTETESKLSFKVAGIVSRIFVKEGESVTKGQLLATLDLTEADAQVAQSRNAMEKNKRDMERGQRLYKDSAATLEQIQNLQTALDVSQENLRIASFNRQYATIHAPASGKVLRKFANEGELATVGTPVLMVNSSAQSDWIVRVGLPDVDWVRVRKGDAATITTDAYPGIVLSGVVSAVNEGADAVGGLYQAEVRIKPSTYKLASGLFARVSITPSGASAGKSIPVEALVEGNGKKAFVFVAGSDQKTVKKLPVDVAYIHGGDAIISKGLDGVTEVVTGGSAFLTENSTITIIKK
jgi:membrane fusion protein, multidrug efflux system